MLRDKLLLLVVLLWWTNTLGGALRVNVKDVQGVGYDFNDIDSLGNSGLDKVIYNPENLEHFLQKLHQLDSLQSGKINIVHIGDSHIQADFFTGRMRTLLQERFGNGGLGFAFPYKLARTNGNSAVRYASNVPWDSYRNIYPVNGANVGLSGIALSTSNQSPVIELSVRQEEFKFSRVKIFTPDGQQIFNVGTAQKAITLHGTTPKNISHRIKSGESLSTIARKYKVSVAAIKKLNKMKSDNIVAGKTLSIPSEQKQPVSVDLESFTLVQATQRDGFYDFVFDKEMDQIYFYPSQKLDLYDLNGIVLENTNPGVVYHSIGVNGAKYSDYTKYPLFFEQLKGLEPDLVIVSMGTNEAFDKMQVEDFSKQVNEFLQELKKTNPLVEVLVTSPPPSYFGKNKPNTIVSNLSNELIINGIGNKYALWDLYYSLGGTLGLQSLQDNGYLAKDLVHYTVKGYEYSADLFFEALMQSYKQLYLK